MAVLNYLHKWQVLFSDAVVESDPRQQTDVGPMHETRFLIASAEEINKGAGLNY